uniref:Ubiquitin-like 3a n=1 Tax=Astatotilapia calliptera TaxID=8154 RepID=A0AAX7TY84_ASTCA
MCIFLCLHFLFLTFTNAVFFVFCFLLLPVLQINLRLILVSGKTKEFLFSPNDSAADIAKHVYDNWPMDWEEEQVSSPNILRLIYQGRFLHGNVTLGGCRRQVGLYYLFKGYPAAHLLVLVYSVLQSCCFFY